MNIIDIMIILFVAIFVVAGYKNGVIKEAVSLVGMIAVLVIAFLLKEHVGNILCKYLPFFEFGGKLEGLVSLNILMYQVIGFFAVATILLSVYSLILKASGVVQKLINMTVILAIPSKIAGAVLGLIEGIIIVYVILLALLIPLNDYKYYKNSTLTNKILSNTPIISSKMKNVTTMINTTYNLANKINNNSITVNEANLEIIKNMINYKIVSKKTIEQLVVLDKLKGVSGIDKIIK